ncbi:MAG: ethylbenzene dehydrogenase-related protein [Wenzhouxiangella sp.]
MLIPRKRRLLSLTLTACAGLLLGLATATASVPDDADDIRALQVAVVYNDHSIQIRYRYETDQPSWYHQVWRYTEGEWVRHGAGRPGRNPHGLYEDRISMMLDDGSVEDFARLGGFMTVHEGVRTFDSAVDSEQVEAHPKLGRDMGRDDVRKFLPASRNDADQARWDDIVSDDELEAMRDRGEFIDLWQWRAHRSNPVGKADNGLVLHYRLSSDGQGMYTTNWDDEAGQPAWMYDPEKTGKRSLSWQRLIERGYGQDDLYYLSEDHAVAFDPDHDWQEGDVIPQRFLREPSGSRGAIDANGRHRDGAWEVVLTRSLAAPDPRDSKTLEPGGSYNVAFAVHQSVGARWHRIALPHRLHLHDGEDLDSDNPAPRIVAYRVEGDLDTAKADYTDVPLIHPGQINWQWLHGEHHPGQRVVKHTQVGFNDVADIHPLEQLMQWIRHHDETGELPEDVQP